MNAYKGNAHLIAYSATKGAIVAYTRSRALALADRGIRANGVAPVPVWTKVAECGSQVSMQRAAQPSEIAPSYVLLAGNDGSYTTRQAPNPNGGYIVSD